MQDDRGDAVRIALYGLVGAGWLFGLVSQVLTRASTGYMDIFPAQLLLGVLLCLGAGAAARLAGPQWHTVRRGALAGIGMIVSIVAGYLVLTALLWSEAWSGGGGETWFSLLLEAPFWIGVPLLTGAVLGALGWAAVNRTMGAASPRGRPR